MRAKHINRNSAKGQRVDGWGKRRERLAAKRRTEEKRVRHELVTGLPDADHRGKAGQPVEGETDRSGDGDQQPSHPEA